jgi:hypothetical protein
MYFQVSSRSQFLGIIMIFKNLLPKDFFISEISSSRCYQGQVTGPFMKLARSVFDAAGIEYNAVCMGTGFLCVFPDELPVNKAPYILTVPSVPAA